SVEDSGLVMSGVALERAERAVSGEPLDLTSLSGTRLGLAVVGCLARKHGLQVSFRPSARGGTGVLLLIPQLLLSRPKTADAPAARPTEERPTAVRAGRRQATAAHTSRSDTVRHDSARVPAPRPAPDTPTDTPTDSAAAPGDVSSAPR